MSGQPISERDIKIIIELTERGESRYEIARRVKHSTATVYKYQKIILDI